MNFSVTDTNENIYNNEHVYTVPISGYYTLNAKVFKYIPTGEWEEQPNYSKKWWQFWKHSYQVCEKWESVITAEGTALRYLEQGSVIEWPRKINEGARVAKL